MKLKAKFQDEDFDGGEVVEVIDIAYGADGTILLKADAKKGGRITTAYKTLADFNEDWEDYEEPKGYWYIRDGGNIDHNLYGKSIINRHKEIGNYFETKEEAEKAVEKLKAWKRLKDKGFKFKYWILNGLNEVCFTVPDSLFEINGDCISDETRKDLDLLFGGEE